VTSRSRNYQKIEKNPWAATPYPAIEKNDKLVLFNENPEVEPSSVEDDGTKDQESHQDNRVLVSFSRKLRRARMEGTSNR
jgi:hypothetical protein